MPGMFQGRNLFFTLMMFSIYPFIISMFIFKEDIEKVIIGFGIYMAVFLQIKTSLELRKREYIDGNIWLNSWTVRDLVYSQELLWGVKDPILLDFKIGEDIKEMDYYIEMEKTLEKELKEPDEPEKKDSKKDKEKDNKKDEDKPRERNDKEKEVDKIIQLSKPTPEEIAIKILEFINNNKEKDKDEKIKKELIKYIEKLIETDIVLKNVRGAYIYKVLLSQDTEFEDSEEHKFAQAIFVTRYPWEFEFHPIKLSLEVDGYYLKSRASNCALRVNKWINDKKPLITVDWSETDSLRALTDELNVIPDKSAKKEIRILRSIIREQESTASRFSETTKRLEQEKDKYRDLYETFAQKWELARDDFFERNAALLNKIHLDKKLVGFIVIVMVLLLAQFFSRIFGGI